jgi:hypothetical protein
MLSMDYQKIYDRFISDRREKEQYITGYSERHHIVPRSLGGPDVKSNLISLTARDHYFAHLLLAKIHGGKMWAALSCMAHLSYGCKRSDLIRYSNMFEKARERAAKWFSDNYSGRNHPLADHSIYSIVTPDNNVITGDRQSIKDATGLSTGDLCKIISGGRSSAKGYCLAGVDPKEKRSVSMSSKEELTLYHFDGRKFFGTRRDFREMTGKRFYIQSGSHHCFGWYRDELMAKKHFDRINTRCKNNSKARGSISGKNNPNADKRKYAFYNEETGETVLCTRSEMISSGRAKKSGMAAIFSGRQRVTNGWRLEKGEV